MAGRGKGVGGGVCADSGSGGQDQAGGRTWHIGHICREILTLQVHPKRARGKELASLVPGSYVGPREQAKLQELTEIDVHRRAPIMPTSTVTSSDLQ